MLDGVAHVGPGVFGLRGLYGVQHEPDRRRRLSMRARLEPCPVSSAEDLAELRRLVIENSVVVRIARIAIREVGRRAAQGPVGVQLDSVIVDDRGLGGQ